MASIVSKDGTVFDIADVHFEEYYSESVGSKTYPEYIRGLELYTNLTTVEIPFDTIERIERGTEGKFTVTLLTGERLEGKMGRRDEAEFFLSTQSFKGQMTVHGYSSEFEAPIASIASMVFSRDEQGDILMAVTTEDGNTTEISEPWCLRRARSPFRGTWNKDYLKFQVSLSTLEIPLVDIATVVIGEEETTLTLRSGEELVGKIPSGNYLSGRTTVIGLPAFFYASLDDEIKSVTFR